MGNDSFVGMIHLRQASKIDIPLIQQLTQLIWPATYGNIISQEQITYMLDMMYSETSLENQLENPNIRFYIIEIDSIPSGFTSVELHIEHQTSKIHKLYLSQKLHGKGYGRIIVEQLEKIVAQNGDAYLILNVNRSNPAVDFYKRIGFEIIAEEDIHIGANYYMNDFVMRKKTIN